MHLADLVARTPRQDLQQLLLGHGAAAVVVEDLEGLPHDVLLEDLLLVERGRQELRVLDGLVTIRAQLLERQVPGNLHALGLNCGAELGHGDVAVAVAVEGLEDLAQVLRVFVGRAPRQGRDRRLLEHVEILEVPHCLDHILHDVRLRQRVAHLQPLVLQGLHDLAARFRLLPEHLRKQCLRILGDLLPTLVLETDGLPPDVVQELVLGLPLERVLARQDYVQDHPRAPRVALLIVLHRSSDQLRCHAVRRPGCPEDLGAFLEGATEAEVNQLDVADQAFLHGVREHDILRLQVPEHEACLVQIRERAKDLPHDIRSVGLGELCLLAEGLEQRAACTDVHHKVDVPSILVAFVRLADVGVVELAQDVELLLDLVGIRHLLPRDRLHGNEGGQGHTVGADVTAFVDNAEASAAQLLQKLVVVVQLAILDLGQSGPVEELQVSAGGCLDLLGVLSSGGGT
mmetsp:Transcript_24356/g.61802  ORF Transcript_24356/g.61802 Transcript_24356/m.61802 type:complete len:458 (-) Transcript_24356:190-1563(-)